MKSPSCYIGIYFRNGKFDLFDDNRGYYYNNYLIRLKETSILITDGDDAGIFLYLKNKEYKSARHL